MLHTWFIIWNKSAPQIKARSAGLWPAVPRASRPRSRRDGGATLGHGHFSRCRSAYFLAVVLRSSSADPFNKLRSTATSEAIPVRSAGSTSGVKSGEWLEGNVVPSALAWANFSGSAPPRLK